MTISATLAVASAVLVCAPAITRPASGQFAVSGAACGLGKAISNGLFTLYWESLDVTEVCVKAEVSAVSPTRIELYFGAAFKGRRLESVPVLLFARARSNATIGEASFRRPRFILQANTRQLDLITAGRSYQLVDPCDQSHGGCPYDSVVSRITADELLTLADAEAISGHVLGAEVQLTKSGLEAVRTLASLLRNR